MLSGSNLFLARNHDSACCLLATLFSKKCSVLYYCVSWKCWFWTRLPSHTMLGPCHQGMARPQVAHGRDGFQIWRLAATTLNKESRTAGMVLHLGGWAGADILTPYENSILWNVTQMRKKFWLENLKGRDCLGGLGIDGRIILKWIRKKLSSVKHFLRYYKSIFIATVQIALLWLSVFSSLSENVFIYGIIKPVNFC
jgi:hypothetical protein